MTNTVLLQTAQVPLILSMTNQILNFVRYIRQFAILVFVITRFDCINSYVQDYILYSLSVRKIKAWPAYLVIRRQ